MVYEALCKNSQIKSKTIYIYLFVCYYYIIIIIIIFHDDFGFFFVAILRRKNIQEKY